MSRFTDLFQPNPESVVKEPVKNKTSSKPNAKIIEIDRWKTTKTNKKTNK